MNRIADIINSPGGGGGTTPPANAPWPPGGPYQPPPPASPDEVRIEHDRLADLARRLPDAARPVTGASGRLVGLAVSGASYTSFTYSLAIAYNEVEAFTIRQLRHKAEETVQIHEGVRLNAEAWKAAEDRNTVRWR
ncbi:hypothetical protein [Actinomadura harenae]|uniref:hypothetical protein n=1 Tax=Actinomadura harenae TaxID=2483351 RepID=UPI0011C44E8B|nr:hypothetical protein [Actinomadura harenae]